MGNMCMRLRNAGKGEASPSLFPCFAPNTHIYLYGVVIIANTSDSTSSQLCRSMYVVIIANTSDSTSSQLCRSMYVVIIANTSGSTSSQLCRSMYVGCKLYLSFISYIFVLSVLLRYTDSDYPPLVSSNSSCNVVR